MMRNNGCVSNGAGESVPTLDLATLRRHYGALSLSEDTLLATWAEQIRAWYAEAAAHPDIAEPNAMQVATVDADGRPDVRTVLARGIDHTGVVFFTNYCSAKGEALAAHPYAAGVFTWLPLERQVRFRGPVTKVSPEETAAYFATRPRGAQLAAWASPQSSVLSGRAELEQLLADATRRFGAKETDAVIPPPPNWGGYRIGVDEAEFWQGREYRLHDRLRFRREDDATWTVERLAP